MVSVLAVDDVQQVHEVDMHAAEPSRVLALARALAALPAEILMVSCEPEEMDELSTDLSSAVSAGVDLALMEIRRITRG